MGGREGWGRKEREKDGRGGSGGRDGGSAEVRDLRT